MANAISKTAYYTLGVRVADAASSRPICGDSYAARFMDDEARRIWERFKDFKRPNDSNAARHRIIDELVQAELSQRRQARVVVIGAGFDTRAYRLEGGRWLEVDEPGIISHKNALLPATSAKNPLERIAIEFDTESLLTRLEPFKDTQRTHLIIEGVFMYLTQAQRQRLLGAVRELFPHHVVYCDLMKRAFHETYGRELHEEIAALGTSFRDMTNEPEALFLEEGYTATSCTSITLRATELGGTSVQAFMVRWFLRSIREGFQVWKFERGVRLGL
jgi:methyltransferase (TIGR00027 family)